MNLSDLVDAVLLERQKRFLARVKFRDGMEAWAHCPNPGSMKGNAIAGSPVRLFDYGQDYAKTGRKLRYRWILVNTGAWVCIDTSLANPLIEVALRDQRIKQFVGWEWRREQSYAESRFDFGAVKGKKKAFLEVKSVSMAEDGVALFPDSVTLRGQKHLTDLIRARKQGHESHLLFLVQREDCSRFKVAKEIDPEYARLLVQARDAGVLIEALRVSLADNQLVVGKKVSVEYV